MDPTLQKRLIGASVLIVLAIIFVPMLLDGGEQPGAETLPLAIPQIPEGDFETREVPLDGATTATPTSVADAIGVAPAQVAPDADALATVDTTAATRIDAVSGAEVGDAAADSAATATDDVAPVGTEADPAPTASVTTPASTPAVADDAPPMAGQGRFLVALGSYSNVANTNALIAQLRGAGFKVQSDTVAVNGQNATRLRVGPYATRGQAEAARLGVKALRADLPGTISEIDDSPTPTVAASARPASATSAWAVQIGAFQSESEAATKRDQLRGGGFAAFIEKINAEAGPLFRVRVGPENKRADADAVKAGIKSRFALDGIVVPYP